MARTLTVKGNGSVRLKPDMIIVRIDLRSRSDDYAETIDRGVEVLESVRTLLGRVGVDRESLRTSSFSIDAEYEPVPEEKGGGRKLKGYVCSHRLRLELEFDMQQLSGVIAALALCREKPEVSIRFSVRDKNAVTETLLVNATDNAFDRAEILAEAAEIKLGQLISIDYSWGELPLESSTVFNASTMLSMPLAASGMAIEPEDIRAEENVTFVWEIQ